MPTRLKDTSINEGKRAAFIGQWFRNRRVEIKRTLKQCSQLSELSEVFHSSLERGQYDPLKIAVGNIPGMSRAYNIRPEAILWRLGIIDPPSVSDWNKIKKIMEED